MLPYEYIICILLSLNPPLWYYVMNPKVDAVMRAKRGEMLDGEEDQWNRSMPLSKADRLRDLVVKFYLSILTLGLSYLALRNGIFH